MIVQWVQFDWTVVFFALDMLLCLFLACITWLHNGEVDQLKESAEEKKKNNNKLSGSIQESTPLLMTAAATSSTESSSGPRWTKSPEESANVFSKALFLWTNSLYALGLTTALEQSDLWPLASDDKGEEISRHFAQQWDRELSIPDKVCI